MERESVLALFKQLETDVKACLEKDLDTDAELKKKKDFTNNFTAMSDFLVKLKAPNGIQADVKDILKLLGEWDVYAYWFKEMKDLVAKIKGFMTNFTSFAENSGILPKAQKPVEKPTASTPQEKPGIAPPAKPIATSLLKPIVLGASPQKPAPPSIPAMPSDVKPPASIESDMGSSAVPRERTVPVLKPVFKIPPVKVPATAGNATPAASVAAPSPTGALKSIETPVIDETSSPVPLKALVEEKKLEIRVKPVKLIKPIMAVQTPSQVVEKTSEKEEPQAKLAVPAISTKQTAFAAKPIQSISPKPSSTEKPLLIPKPIKILVPDLDNINLDNELGENTQEKSAPEAPPESPGEGGALFSEMDVIEGPVLAKTPPPRVVKPIPVKIQIGKAVPKDPNDEIVEDVVERVAQRLDENKAKAQKAPAAIPKAAPVEDEYITPMEVSPEEIDAWSADDNVQPAIPLKPAKAGATTKKDVIEALDAAESWDDDKISSILDEAMDSSVSDVPTKAVKDDQGAGPVTFKRPVKTPEPDGEKEASSKISVDVMDKEPKKSRLQEIKKTGQAVEPGPVDSMSLFMGGLDSKRGDRKASTQGSSLSLFRPGGMVDAKASTVVPGQGAGKAATMQPRPATPIGSDVDIEALPDTKDGLYQALIALEGKRYAIERARKDLRTDLDKGIIKQPTYEQKLADLKAEMDKIAEKIKEIREKIKKFK
ncbi:MAG: hypothetical protein Q6353_013120 [Candidatus Sigynarchaeum springense]